MLPNLLIAAGLLLVAGIAWFFTRDLEERALDEGEKRLRGMKNGSVESELMTLREYYKELVIANAKAQRGRTIRGALLMAFAVVSLGYIQGQAREAHEAANVSYELAEVHAYRDCTVTNDIIAANSERLRVETELANERVLVTQENVTPTREFDNEGFDSFRRIQDQNVKDFFNELFAGLIADAKEDDKKEVEALAVAKEELAAAQRAEKAYVASAVVRDCGEEPVSEE